VKATYWYNLVASYSDLPQPKQTLSKEEFELLGQANEIYSRKDFEYFRVDDAATGYRRFPDLNALAQLARKITAYDA
jgi:hypothetical protein